MILFTGGINGSAKKSWENAPVTVGDRDYFFRPSFMAMSRIGEPAEIVQTFYDLFNDEITPLIQRVVEAYGRVPEWLAKHLSALHLDKKSLLAAHGPHRLLQ